ncbi:MAG: ABC transporter permease [Lachnospiraceae bacterium]
MKNILAILEKQCRDTLKNKTVLIQFLMFPLLGIIMCNSIKLEGMPDNFFVYLFATMFIGMAPLTSVSAIISEEKEKNTLPVLLLANVTPLQYLIGIGSYVFAACMLGCVVFCILGHFTGMAAVEFLLILAVGVLCSISIGAAIGIFCKNQMAATSITVPVMMIFSFLPMVSMFNETIAKIARFTYSEQIRRLLESVGDLHPETKECMILAGNILIFVFLFMLAYWKRGLKAD